MNRAWIVEEATHNFAQTQKLENSQNIKKKKKPILKKNVKIVDSIQLNQINLINDLRTQEIPNLFSFLTKNMNLWRESHVPHEQR